MKDIEITRMNTSDQETLLDEWHDKFITKRLQHLKTAKRFSVANWIFGIINVILSTVGTVFSTVNATETFMGFSSNIVNAIIHFFVLSFTGIQHFAHFQNKEIEHLKASHQYAELSRLIEYQQTLDKNDRNIKDILDRYDKIIEQEPLITCC